MMELPPEQPFGKFILRKKLGIGGMAEVYLAEMSGPDGFARMVALKRVLPHLADDENFIASFISEARLGGSLNHPNIVQTLELGREGDHYYLAMEYIQGLTLAQLLQYRRFIGRPLPMAVAVYIASHLCDALDYAHTATDSRGNPLRMIHRDLKPANVLVSRYGVVKLTDFGVAKAESNLRQTSEMAVKGTIGYMSPEQAYGQELDLRSDLYSLGAVLFELLTLEPLYPNAGGIAGLIRVQKAEIQDRLTLLEPFPPALGGIVIRLLAHPREQRPGSAREVNRELMAIAGTLPATATLELREVVEEALQDPGRSRPPAVMLEPGARISLTPAGAGHFDPLSSPLPAPGGTAALDVPPTEHSQPSMTRPLPGSGPHLLSQAGRSMEPARETGDASRGPGASQLSRAFAAPPTTVQGQTGERSGVAALASLEEDQATEFALTTPWPATRRPPPGWGPDRPGEGPQQRPAASPAPPTMAGHYPALETRVSERPEGLDIRPEQAITAPAVIESGPAPARGRVMLLAGGVVLCLSLAGGWWWNSSRPGESGTGSSSTAGLAVEGAAVDRGTDGGSTEQGSSRSPDAQPADGQPAQVMQGSRRPTGADVPGQGPAHEPGQIGSGAVAENTPGSNGSGAEGGTTVVIADRVGASKPGGPGEAGREKAIEQSHTQGDAPEGGTPGPGSKDPKKGAVATEVRPPAGSNSTAAQAVKKTGRLSVNVRPYATIVIDGNRAQAQETPLAEHELPAGKHTLVFELPDGTSFLKTIEIKPGQHTNMGLVTPD